MESGIQPQNSDRPSIAQTFNLHPNDALQYTQYLYNHLQNFNEGFKERIEIQIEYSKALLKLSKRLHKYINADNPTPLSFISSAFQVQHQQRARHALELAEYLHSEIEIPCQLMLQESEALIKRIDKEFKKFYKDGESVEENYQKLFKKYFRNKQEWEQRTINTILQSYVPGTSRNQVDKAKARITEQKADLAVYQTKYLGALDSFNKFAENYNSQIPQPLAELQAQCLSKLEIQVCSLRKLIVSQVNMFKNIQYDLLNISRQMQLVKAPQQIASLITSLGNCYSSPIISIYSDGPISSSSHIDLKTPIQRTFLEQTLVKIEKGYLAWMLENKNNSTLHYCLQQAWLQFQGKQSEDFLSDLEESITNSKVVTAIPLDKSESLLCQDEVFSTAFSVICTLGSFVRDIPVTIQKQTEVLRLLSKPLSLHHLYRFVAVIALQQFLSLRQSKLTSDNQARHLTLVLRLILEQSFTARDTFVIRLVLNLIFSAQCQYPLFMRAPIKQFDIWNWNDLWQSILFQGTFEEVSILPGMIKSQLRQIYLMQQKNTMFSALTTYCHYMAMMGCEKQQVINITLRFSHVYGLYEEHEKDLLKMIKRSTTDYIQYRKKHRESIDPSDHEDKIQSMEEKIGFKEENITNQEIAEVKLEEIDNIKTEKEEEDVKNEIGSVNTDVKDGSSKSELTASDLLTE